MEICHIIKMSDFHPGPYWQKPWSLPRGWNFTNFPKELHSLVEDRGNFFPHFSFVSRNSKRLVSGKYPKRKNFSIPSAGHRGLALVSESFLAVFTLMFLLPWAVTMLARSQKKGVCHIAKQRSNFLCWPTWFCHVNNSPLVNRYALLKVSLNFDHCILSPENGAFKFPLVECSYMY